MKVLLLSSTQFGLNCLQRALRPLRDIRLAGIVTTAKDIETAYSKGKIRICSYADFRQASKITGCQLWFVKRGDYPRILESAIRQSKPDLVLVLGWYYKVPRTVIERIPFGAVGIHASLLPKYRGGAPLVWSMIQGEKQTGVTLFYLGEKMDAGDLISQQAFPITREDTIASVYKKAEDASVEILKKYVPLLAKGKVPRKKQDESEATTFPQRSPQDGLIDWSWDAERIRNFIRAQTHPYPGAFTFLKGKKVTIWDCAIEKKASKVRK